MVLQENGCENAMTAHRLLYKSYLRKDGSYSHQPQWSIPLYKIIVVDEVSMLPQTLWDLLLSHHIYVLALGDPAQLPPIGKDNLVLRHPHVFLDEIMRQARDNEIIQLTMDIRAGKPLSLYKGKQVQVIDKKDIVSGMYTWADQIICAKNDTRRAINSFMRKQLYNIDSDEPIEGDKLICLHNNWDKPNALGDVMVNGAIGTISYLRKSSHPFLTPMFTFDFLPDGYVVSQCRNDPCFRNVNADYKLLTTGEPTVNKDNFNIIPKGWHPQEFDYGYCITCWKAQGSQYDKVLVFEESFPTGADHQKYLYTAATRAKEKLIIVRQ